MLKHLTIALFLASLATPTLAKDSHATRGYVKKNGTYVAPSRATNPDKTKNNNYSTRGNSNPYTGKAGTKPRDGDAPKRP